MPNIRILDEETFVKDLLGHASLAEIEASVNVFHTALFCNVPFEEIARTVKSAAFPYSTLLSTVWSISKMIARESVISDELSMCTSIATMQKGVQLRRWNRNKQIYSFDRDFISELVNTGETTFPYDFFERLPYQTLYLDFSEAGKDITEAIGLDGCIVQVNKTFFDDTDGKKLEFYVISMLNFNDGDSTHIRTTIVLNDSENGVHMNFSKSNLLMNCDVKKLLETNPVYRDESTATLDEDMAKVQEAVVIQALSYLCSYEPDIRETTASKASYRKAKKNKKKGEDLPARQFQVGERFGEMFRKWTKGQVGQSSDSVSTGRHNKPHMRRAHWHRYWTGKRDSDDRKLIVKWTHECFCGLTEDNAENKLDIVQHRVVK